MVVAKRLCQVALSPSASVLYTAPAGNTTQVTEIYLANNGSAPRIVTILAHGVANQNRVLRGIPVDADGSTIIGDTKITLAAGETFAANQDAGTDVVLTAYGVEEVV